jgi:hypothetical protein
MRLQLRFLQLNYSSKKNSYSSRAKIPVANKTFTAERIYFI